MPNPSCMVAPRNHPPTPTHPHPHYLRRVLPILRRVEGRLRKNKGVLRSRGGAQRCATAEGGTAPAGSLCRRARQAPAERQTSPGASSAPTGCIPGTQPRSRPATPCQYPRLQPCQQSCQQPPLRPRLRPCARPRPQPIALTSSGKMARSRYITWCMTFSPACQHMQMH